MEIDGEENDLYKELEAAMCKTSVNWGHVRRLCEEIDRQCKQAELVADRLMGNSRSNGIDLAADGQDSTHMWTWKFHNSKST
jgi:hypothetical protein